MKSVERTVVDSVGGNLEEDIPLVGDSPLVGGSPLVEDSPLVGGIPLLHLCCHVGLAHDKVEAFLALQFQLKKTCKNTIIIMYILFI